MNITKKSVLSLSAAALIGAAVFGVPSGWFMDRYAHAATIAAPATSVQSAGSAATQPAPAQPSMALPDFTALVDRYGPAVVNIAVTGHTKTAFNPRNFGFAPNDPFSQFFRGFPNVSPRNMPTHGEGSGFIVSSDGVILTNAHVVDDAQQVTVKLTDKREFTAKVLGSDKQSDVAVIKIDAKNLPIVRLGRDTDLKVGQWVVAIGAPFGFDNSVTAGIVSAKQRALPNSGYVPFIQTDVPINPGNSGGPLFNLSGEVVGINSQIYSQTGGYQGLAFAIPIDVAMDVSHQIQAHGHVEHGKLGVTIQEVNQALADTFGLDKPKGALVASVDAEGPAGHAGMKSGDVILAVNGKAIAQSLELPMMIAQSKPGTTVKVKVWRDRSEQTIDVKLGNMNAENVASNDANGGRHGKLGIAVRPLSPEEREQANAQSNDPGGLLVEDSSGAAADAGIQSGDIVLSANGTPVKSAAELNRIVDKANHHIALLVQRGNTRIFVPVTVG